MTGRAPILQPDWIAPERTALVLIDCQVDFALPDGAMGRRGADTAMTEAALGPAAMLADAARAAGVVVIFVRYVPGDESAVRRQAKARHKDSQPDLCVPGTRGAAFCGPMPKTGERIVSKPLFSAFAGTGLDRTLHDQGVDTLVLVGLTTECCVAASAWDAFGRDLHVFIATDACAAYQADLHQGALKALQLSGAILGRAEDFIQAWKI